jgi:hypothetical protein
MTRMILTIAAAGLLAGVTGSAFADDPPEGRIQQRKENQQTRIGNGVKNGTLSPKETVNLEKKEGKLNREIHHDRVQNGGNLTNKEKARINRQQNHLSRQIYKTKHDGAGK